MNENKNREDDEKSDYCEKYHIKRNKNTGLRTQ
jgi:hypothetical protein